MRASKSSYREHHSSSLYKYLMNEWMNWCLTFVIVAEMDSVLSRQLISLAPKQFWPVGFQLCCGFIPKWLYAHSHTKWVEKEIFR